MDKPLPCDIEAERAVLGSILLSPPLITLAASLVRPDHFLEHKHRKLYETLLLMPTDQFDGILIRQHMTPEVFDRIGGYGFLADLIASTPHAARLPYYADIVVEYWRKRQLILIAESMKAGAHGRECGSREIGLDALEAIHALDAGPAQPTRIADLLKDALAHDQERLIETGLAELDALTGGLKAGELTVVGARPSVGKSALLLSIASDIAIRGMPVLFVSLELTAKAVTRRVIAGRAGVPVLAIARGNLTEFQDRRVHQAESELREVPLHVVTPNERYAGTIAALIRLNRMRHNIALACVDYIQLIREHGKAEKRYIEVGRVVAELKALALELNIPILSAAQLRRESEQRDRPALADLRESGDIEQTADNVWLLHRPPVTVTNEHNEPVEIRGILQDRSVATLWVAKARDGETTGHNGIRLRFEIPGMRYVNYIPLTTAAVEAEPISEPTTSSTALLKGEQRLGLF